MVYVQRTAMGVSYRPRAGSNPPFMEATRPKVAGCNPLASAAPLSGGGSTYEEATHDPAAAGVSAVSAVTRWDRGRRRSAAEHNCIAATFNRGAVRTILARS